MAASYSQDGCAKILASIAEHGLPTATPSKDLTVAGITFKPRGKMCWAYTPQKATCFLDGGIQWHHGDAADARQWQNQKIKTAPFSPFMQHRQETADELNRSKDKILVMKQMQELQATGTITTMEAKEYTAGMIKQFRMERHPGKCRIAGVQRDCERVDYYGVLSSPAEYHYYAQVPDGDGFTVLQCKQSAKERAPIFCEQIFGDFLVR